MAQPQSTESGTQTIEGKRDMLKRPCWGFGWTENVNAQLTQQQPRLTVTKCENSEEGLLKRPPQTFVEALIQCHQQRRHRGFQFVR